MDQSKNSLKLAMFHSYVSHYQRVWSHSGWPYPIDWSILGILVKSVRPFDLPTMIPRPSERFTWTDELLMSGLIIFGRCGQVQHGQTLEHIHRCAHIVHILGDGFEVIYGPIAGILMTGWYRMHTTHLSHVAWLWHILFLGDMNSIDRTVFPAVAKNM